MSSSQDMLQAMIVGKTAKVGVIGLGHMGSHCWKPLSKPVIAQSDTISIKPRSSGFWLMTL